jgi:hypothetical protein
LEEEYLTFFIGCGEADVEASRVADAVDVVARRLVGSS